MSTILCVDDEPAILSALQRELSRYGKVITANGPAQALSLLAKEEVALVVSDFRMPGMDGLQLLHLLRKTYPNAVRIVLTANDLDPTSQSVAEADAFRFLPKPWNRRDLHTTVERALSQPKLCGSVVDELEAEHPGISLVQKTDEGFIEIPMKALDDAPLLEAWLR